MEKHDLIVIGIGPGGLSAGIYAARYKMDFLLIGQTPGGYVSVSNEIYNYPGFSKTTGMELTTAMMNHAKELEIPIKNEVVKDIQKTEQGIVVTTNKSEYLARKLILTTGSSRRELNLSREKELAGKGISYCATCDAGFQKDKIVGVVGGGDAALTAALIIAKFAKKVYLLYRKDKFTKPEVAWIKDVEANKKIETKFNVEVKEFLGQEKLEGVKFQNGETLELDSLFVEIGSDPNIEVSKNLNLDLDEGYIKVDSSQRTNVEGVFAAGDVTNRPFKQIIPACGDAATALSTAFKEIQKENAESQ